MINIFCFILYLYFSPTIFADPPDVSLKVTLLDLSENIISPQNFATPSVIQSSLGGTLPTNGLDSEILPYYGDSDLCSLNSSFVLPSGGQKWTILGSRGNCTLNQKLSTANSLNAEMLILYMLNNTQSVLTDLTDSLSQTANIPVLLTDGQTSTWLSTAYTYLLQKDGRKMKLTAQTRDQDSLGIWEFTLIVIIVLLGISFIASIAMHCHLYRMRRRRLNEIMERQRREDSRVTVLNQNDLGKFPVMIFTKEPKAEEIEMKTLERKIDMTTENSRASIITNIDTCAICIEDFTEGEEIRNLPCHHQFHKECIDPWLTTKKANCPMCKLSFLQDEEVVSPITTLTQPSQTRLQQIIERLSQYFHIRSQRERSQSLPMVQMTESTSTNTNILNDSSSIHSEEDLADETVPLSPIEPTEAVLYINNEASTSTLPEDINEIKEEAPEFESAPDQTIQVKDEQNQSETTDNDHSSL